MASTEEALLALLGLVASVIYGAVAWIQSKRSISPASKAPMRGFILWWGGLAALGPITAFFTFGPDLSTMGMTVVRLVIYLLFALIWAMCAGLVYYLLFLYTGRRQTVWWAAIFYTVLYALFVYSIEGFAPHIAAQHTTGEIQFHTHLDAPVWLGAIVGLGLILPLLGSAMAYALLFFQTTDITARYRIFMVSTGLIIWFLFSSAGTITRIVAGDDEQSFAGRFTSQVLGIIAASLTLMAYNPPRFIQERFRLRDITARTHSVGSGPRMAPQ